MEQFCRHAAVLHGAAVVFYACSCLPIVAGDEAETEKQLRQLQRENQALQEQMRRQGQLIEELSRKVSTLETTATQETKRNSGDADAVPAASSSSTFSLGKVHIGGEGQV